MVPANQCVRIDDSGSRSNVVSLPIQALTEQGRSVQRPGRRDAQSWEAGDESCVGRQFVSECFGPTESSKLPEKKKTGPTEREMCQSLPNQRPLQAQFLPQGISVLYLPNHPILLLV